ncbi:DUF6602 domain-containing protein [Rhizobium sp. R693]|uniref:DUF6602 domain-containing protein n=1 Tax=Rhizobium sp. R693 TaxID=1764276 RepID=UPI000B52DF74|nr:DUF6602 domain-containing protein [Rhizobium sp. R693]OWV91015.1 hypothetical protein ATY79_06385 [Rhizobium sp. R693]
MRKRVHQGHAVPDFVDRFGIAIAHFSLRIRETKNIKHRGAKGTERETDIRHFLKELLPSRYEVVVGEAVDLFGNKSPQMDVIIFDRDKNFPFYAGDYFVIPAEALLVSIEVKSKLTAAEAEKCIKSATDLKDLRPGKQRIVRNVGTETDKFRYFHVVFAYDTDIGKTDWATKEADRLTNGGSTAIDFVYVLDRGLINLKDRKVMPEDNETGQALVALHFAINNFLDRENGRRDPAPYFSYATDLNRFWKKT